MLSVGYRKLKTASEKWVLNPCCLLWHGKESFLSHTLAEIFQSVSKLKIIHIMLSNLSLKCSSLPECDHGICNVITLEVQVK